MKRGIRIALALCALATVSLLGAGAASAQSGSSYEAVLRPVNNQTGAGGTLMLTLDGNRATIVESVHGLAATFNGSPFPHVQHIHVQGNGTCPTAAADTNGDGVISTPEGQPAYGHVQTTLSVSGDTSAAAATNIKIAPSGSSFSYRRTIMLDATSLQQVKAGNAVIVVHGVDPAKIPAAAKSKSPLVPSLPLAATAPALCGHLAVAQMGVVPTGGAATGGGSTAGIEDVWLFVLGGLGLAGAAVAARKATARQQ